MATSSTLPETARGIAVDHTKGYVVQQIGEGTGVYYLGDGFYNTIFMVTSEGVICVDSPETIGEKYLKAVADVTDKPIKYLIYSHHHTDHIGGTHSTFGRFGEGVTIIAHEETHRHLTKAKDPRRPLPSITFKEELIVRLGDDELVLSYKGINHDEGNIYIYAPKQKVFVLIDVVFPGWLPFHGTAIAKSIRGFEEAHDHILAYDFVAFVGGHLNRWGTKEDVTRQKEFYTELREEAVKANSSVSYAEVWRKTTGGSHDFPGWKVTKAFMDEVAQLIADRMRARGWADRLGGFEEYIYDAAWQISEAERVD